MRRGWVFAAILIAASTINAAELRPPKPETSSTSAQGQCRWVWVQGRGIGLWSEACTLPTGRWRVVWRAKTQSFELQRNGRRTDTVVRLWSVAPDDPLETLLKTLKAEGLVPDNEERCVFLPKAIRPDVRTRAFFVIKPQAGDPPAVTPSGEIPEPPCGDLGASTHGVRYFMTDLRAPGRVVFVNEGQDGLMFDPRSITLD